MTLLWVTIPPDVTLERALDPATGAPIRYSFESFLFEYLFSRFDREYGELAAHPAWRRDAEWVEAFVRLERALRGVAVGASVPVEPSDHAKLVEVLQRSPIPARHHAALAPLFLAIVSASTAMPAALHAEVSAAAAAMVADVVAGGEEPHPARDPTEAEMFGPPS